MKNIELKAIIFFMCIFMLTVSVCPVFAVEYNTGVSADQYVKYGNIVSLVNGEDVDTDIEWLILEVSAVSGKNVTLHSSGQYQNGSAFPTTSESTIVYNIENGTSTMGSSTVDQTMGPIIAANLNQGDLIPPTSYGYAVNRTETRMYLNVSRSVNILNMVSSDANYAMNWTIVYDKTSGMMLESSIEWAQYVAPATNSSFSYSVIDTNIFSATEQPEQPFYLQPWFIIGIIVIIVVVIMLVALWMRRKK